MEKRLQKAIADAGMMSRRKAEELIAAGKVTVNGHPAVVGMKVDDSADVIKVNGETLAPAGGKKEFRYILLNKPRGYVCTMSDELGRRCVTELIKDVPVRVYPIGRLDKNSEGMLLLTNDGEFSNQIMHPRYHIPKTYRVTIDGKVSEDELVKLTVGVEIDGETTGPAQVNVLEAAPNRTVLQIVIHEGKNRQVRRMCEAVGLQVGRLKRTAIGPLRLGMLQPGKWRDLDAKEVAMLKNAIKAQMVKAEEAKKREHAHNQKGKFNRGKGNFAKKRV